MKTQNLDLLLLQYNQSQKELVANECFSTIDALFFRYVSDVIDQLPLNISKGVYMISQSAKGELSKYAGYIALYLNGWRYVSPKEGFIFFVESYSDYLIFRNGYWEVLEYKSKKFSIMVEIYNCIFLQLRHLKYAVMLI